MYASVADTFVSPFGPQPLLVTDLSTPPQPSSLQTQLDKATTDPIPLVLSFKYLAEDDALILVLANGEVEQVFLDGAAGPGRVRVLSAPCRFWSAPPAGCAHAPTPSL